jgi:hypothetical protein
MKHTSSIRRFAQAHTDPGDVIGLSPDHAAVRMATIPLRAERRRMAA